MIKSGASRTLFAVAVVLAAALTVTAGEHVGTSPSAGPATQVVAKFSAFDTSTSAGNCGVYDGHWEAQDVSCTFYRSNFFASDAYTISSITLTPGNNTATSNACDVKLLVNNSPVAGTIFELGGTAAQGAPVDLNSLGDTHKIEVEVEIALGDQVAVRHDAPADDTNCDNGSSCTCGSQTFWIATLWGTRN